MSSTLVVLAAHRADHPQFEPARTWLDGLLESGKPFAVTGLVAGSFVRLATNRRIFLTPTPVEDAFAYLRALRDQPGHLTLSPGPGHLELFERSCRPRMPWAISRPTHNSRPSPWSTAAS